MSRLIKPVCVCLQLEPGYCEHIQAYQLKVFQVFPLSKPDSLEIRDIIATFDLILSLQLRWVAIVNNKIKLDKKFSSFAIPQ